VITEEELDLIQNADFIYTKNDALEKIHTLFSEIRDDLINIVQSKGFHLPAAIDSKDNKISRGEFYKDLPYLVLDYPKHFKQESIFAFRTMFWWGNFISFTLHIGGVILNEYEGHLLNNFSKLNQKGYYFCVNNTPWDYHYEADNYQLIETLSKEEITNHIKETRFIKLSKKISLGEISTAKHEAVSTFQDLMEVL